jgi:negative regulator of sigma E activity
MVNPMKFPDEMLMAYADGELDAETRRAIEAAMENDPEIARQVERHRSMRKELGAAFGGVLDERIPDRLIDAAKSAPARSNVADFSAARAAKQAAAARRRWSLPQWIAIAASVLLGVIVGRTALQPPESDLVAMKTGQLVAAGSLANALSNQVGGVPSSDSRVAIAATFRSKAGVYCRAFTASAPEPVAGVACREADQWRVHTLTRGGAKTAGEPYRMAGAELPSIVLQTVESMMVGDALDAPQESAARERGWRAEM